MHILWTTGLGLTAIGCAVMGGVYFTFSGFVMRSLEQTGEPIGIAAMQSINRVILSSSFMPLFMATSLASLALAIVGMARWGEPVARPSPPPASSTWSACSCAPPPSTCR